MDIGQTVYGGSDHTLGNQAEPGTTHPRVLLIIPCFNEGGMVGSLLEEIRSLSLDYDTVVVDDGSIDHTYEVARTMSKVVRLPHNLGIGGAVQVGIKLANRGDYEFCVQIDGDGQHPPGGVALLLKAYREKPRNIIIGSRYLRNDSFRSTRLRRFGSRLIVMALRWLFRSEPITDPTSGMRLMNRAAIELFAHHYPQDYPEPISLAWALRRGLTVGEIPVEMRARRVGRSSIRGLKPFAYMFRVLGYIALARVARVA